MPVLERSASVSFRLMSALHAAHKHSKTGNMAMARRIYMGMLGDQDRFEGIETSAQFWVQYALFEEHSHRYVDGTTPKTM